MAHDIRQLPSQAAVIRGANVGILLPVLNVILLIGPP